MKKYLIMILMLAVSLPAWAAETALSLDEVVVTATRTEEDVDKISSNVTVITQDDIKKSTATTVQDLLRNEAGIIVRDLFGTGTKSTVDMRGFARGLNTAILLDGRKLNEIDLSGVDWNTIPLENIERIEIVRGSASVLYGDNAMAGAINIITKKGFAMKPEIVLDARAESYSGHTELGTLTGGTDQVGYFFFLKHRQTSGYRENSDFIAGDASTRLNFKLTDYLAFDFAAGYHTDDQGLPGGLTEHEVNVDRRQSTKPDDHVNFDQRYIDTKANITLGTWGDLELGYSFNDKKFDSDLFFFGSSFNTKRDTATSGIKAKLTVDTKPFNFRNLLVAGFDYYDSDVSNSSKGFFTTDADIKKVETGLYIQDEFFLTDKLSLSLGYRYANTKFEDTVTGFGSESDEQRFTEDAYRAGITYNYAKGSKVYASYAKGYRLPTTDELFDFTGIITDLKPEKSDTFEAGIVHAFGNRFQARITLFTMNVRDELFFNPVGGTFGFGANENLDKTRHNGAEAGFSAAVTDNLNIFGSFTYTDAKFESGPFEGNHIQLVPRYSASVGGDFRFLKSFLFAANATWVDRKYFDNDVENQFDKMESYTVVNAKLSYTYKSLTAYVGVNNIFGEEYSEYGIV
ncbi:MAG TPA: TonB-dependent receptor, partial [Thermodesulfovibrionales bacterium]|nr:TonB-dependent receptor [Thermodesulfovibrionales bacterium]